MLNKVASEGRVVSGTQDHVSETQTKKKKQIWLVYFQGLWMGGDDYDTIKICGEKLFIQLLVKRKLCFDEHLPMVKTGELVLEALLPALPSPYQRHQNTWTNLGIWTFFLFSQHGALKKQRKPGKTFISFNICLVFCI